MIKTIMNKHGRERGERNGEIVVWKQVEQAEIDERWNR